MKKVTYSIIKSWTDETGKYCERHLANGLNSETALRMIAQMFNGLIPSHKMYANRYWYGKRMAQELHDGIECLVPSYSRWIPGSGLWSDGNIRLTSYETSSYTVRVQTIVND